MAAPQLCPARRVSRAADTSQFDRPLRLVLGQTKVEQTAILLGDRIGLKFGFVLEVRGQE
jgi:hypothetical protein